MEKKFLKELGLDEESIAKILAENSKEVEEEQGKVAAKEGELAAANSTIATLRQTAQQFEGVDVAALQQQLAQADQKHQQELKAAQVDGAISLALAKAGALNVVAVKALLTMQPEEVELEADGTVKGLAEKIEALKTAEDSKMLFPVPEAGKKMEFKGFRPGEGRDSGETGPEPQTLADAVGMNLRQHMTDPNND